jgi:hypothetical protein
MSKRYNVDDEVRAWLIRILRGIRYKEMYNRLLGQSAVDEHCHPTIARMAEALRTSEEEAQEVDNYVRLELEEDKLVFVRYFPASSRWF